MKTRLILLLISATLMSAACNKTDFKVNDMPSEAPIQQVVVSPPIVPPPVIPPPVVPPPVIPPPAAVVTKGTCAPDSSTNLLACMNCVVPPVPPPPPPLSKKGQALWDIMTMACQVPNGPQPVGYVQQTRSSLFARISRASDTLYPDTPMTTYQNSVITDLSKNPLSVKSMFGGLFLSGVTGPTIAFETYFGIEVGEAYFNFCFYGSDGYSLSTFNVQSNMPLHSKAWWDCQSSGAFSCTETPAYVAANVSRNQLRNSMIQSIQNPYVAPPPSPAKTCNWEKYEGLNDAKATAQINTWLAAGFTVGAEIASTGVCQTITAPLSGNTGNVALAAFECH